MPSTLLKASVFLTYLFLASARPQDHQTQADAWGIGALNDWASSGNYLIYSCGSEVTDVKNILDQTYLFLQTAILSTDSPAYKAFFRSAAPSSVTAVLKRITAGTNITETPHGSRRPTMVCVNAIDQHIRTFWYICQENEGTVVIQPPGTAVVFLCPIFFSRPSQPQSTECGTVNSAGTKLIPRGYIAGSQYGFLVRALADMYIRETMGGSRASAAKVGEENACMALPPDQALINPSSYAFYVSNIRAGCTQFPSRVSIERDRELLAVDGGAGGGNGTNILTMGCFGVGANSTSCAA